MFCTSCGGKLRDGAKFCIYCGAPQKVKADAGFDQADNFGADGGFSQDGYGDNQYAQDGYGDNQYAQDGYGDNQYAQDGYGDNQYAPNGYADNQPSPDGYESQPYDQAKYVNNQITEPLNNSSAGLLVLQDTKDADKLYACDLSTPAIMGRDGASCTLVISDERSVSRRHCSFYRRGNACYVEDLKSFNHTWLNGKMIEGPTEIHVGDKLTLGAAELVVVECDFNQ